MPKAEEPVAGPSDPPPYTAATPSEDTPSGMSLCAVRYINKTKGYGLVATQDIPTGTLIFKEPMLAFHEDLDSYKSATELNMSLAEEVKAMGPEFARGFFSLPTVGKDHLGIFGGILKGSKILALHDAKAVAMIGLNLSFVNHACSPNAQHTWIMPNKKGGDGKKHQTVTMYACKYIAAGDEITISYHHVHNDTDHRRAFIKKYFDFLCACDFCMEEDLVFDSCMRIIDQQMSVVHDLEVIDSRPNNALQVAYTIGTLMEKNGLFDARLAKLYEHCAIIVGWHSDEARATEFLARAQAMFINLEGANGPDVARIAGLQQDVRMLPSFGCTKRCLSKKEEVKILWLNPDQGRNMLFMDGLQRYDRKRLRDYQGVRGNSAGFDDEEDDEEAGTEHGSDCGHAPEGNEAEEDNGRAEVLESLIEELSLEKDEFEKERQQNQGDSGKKAKGVKGRKAKKGKGKSKG
ncbi:hypothetical protein FQN54_000787 [Arachnomyces sp. PD_36]|nr:hypothetical protein FQN54_000787 [Arachnomyces sp. PD_36]